jgi:hypothetical protein
MWPAARARVAPCTPGNCTEYVADGKIHGGGGGPGPRASLRVDRGPVVARSRPDRGPIAARSRPDRGDHAPRIVQWTKQISDEMIRPGVKKQYRCIRI